MRICDDESDLRSLSTRRTTRSQTSQRSQGSVKQPRNQAFYGARGSGNRPQEQTEAAAPAAGSTLSETLTNTQTALPHHNSRLQGARSSNRLARASSYISKLHQSVRVWMRSVPKLFKRGRVQ